MEIGKQLKLAFEEVIVVSFNKNSYSKENYQKIVTLLYR